MQKLRIETPRMYGDHHVTAVRRLLFELPGVIEIYASSCFAIVEIDYDPALLGPAELQAALEAGAIRNLCLCRGRLARQLTRSQRTHSSATPPCIGS